MNNKEHKDNHGHLRRSISNEANDGYAGKYWEYIKNFRKYGTFSLTDWENAIGRLPTKNHCQKEREIGIIETGKCNKKIEFIHGKLNIGEAMPTPLIKAVKKRIEKYKNTPKGQAPTGQASEQEITIVDVSPGTSCPMVEAVKGSDYCILVTEPTPFGLNDLFLAVEVLKKLKISFGVIINRSDIGDRKVERYCNKENIQILMRIPFDREIARTYSKGIPIVEAIPKYRQDFAKLYEKICTFP